MTFLFERDFRIGFFSGILLHIWFIIPRVSFLQLKCYTDCSGILTADIPMSIFYFAFSDGVIIVLSFLFGSILWGVWFYLMLRVIKFAVSKFVR